MIAGAERHFRSLLRLLMCTARIRALGFFFLSGGAGVLIGRFVRLLIVWHENLRE